MSETFWNILDSHKIEIPEIQRDYAQGRKNSKVEAIRKEFVKDLLSSLKGSKKLNLDFIFGYSVDEKKQAEVESNKSNLKLLLSVLEQYGLKNDLKLEAKISSVDNNRHSAKTLIPIDGQQRLTTLFLLHLYIGSKAEANIDPLKGFLYKTRESSTLFLENLVDKFSIVLSEVKNQNLSEIICDQKWFFNSWLKDPTVFGMLVMIDEINEQISTIGNRDFKYLWENLTIRNTVVFDFYDIDENNLGNDLYIKMNARGKPLNEFENFKAWLQKKNPSKIDGFSDWMTSIDKEWLDIFWRKSSISSVEDNFLSFFENMALLTKSQFLNVKEEESKKDINDYFKHLGNNEFQPISYYEKGEIFDSNSLNFTFDVLKRFSKTENLEKIDELVEDIWIREFYNLDEKNKDNKFSSALFIHFSNLNLFHRAFIYGVLRFVHKISKSVSEYDEKDIQNFKDWLRISRNLVYNARIDDNLRFVQAVQAIYSLGDNILNIKRHIRINSDSWISYFREIQRKEEREKVLELDNDWESIVHRAEDHFYFHGQIQFILNLSKSESGKYDLDRFQTYFERLEKLFSKENIINEKKLFRIQRLLLVSNDESAKWMKELSAGRWSFYSSDMSNSRKRDENWRYLFNEKLKYLKNVLNIPNFENIDIDEYLNQSKKGIADWRYFFIDNPKLISVCRQRLINWSSDYHIRLLGQSRLSHYHYELRSYALYLMHFKNDENIKYKRIKRGSETPSILFNYKDVGYEIIFNSKNKCFKYKRLNSEMDDFKIVDKDLPVINDTITNFNSYC